MDDLLPLHNISFAFNLTSIFDYLPNRLLSRFIWKTKPVASPTQLTITSATISDFIATTDWETPLALAAKAQTTTNAKTKLSSLSERSGSLGPLGFFTSGYMLGLFLMAFVLHRLHNTMVPPRLSRRGLRHGRIYTGRAIIFIRIYRSIFPIDLSRTFTRFILQFPTLYCLVRMVFLWCLLILQTSGVYPETFPSWTPGWVSGTIQYLGSWASHKAMEDICWISFCSLSAAYFVESFVRKLDELANGATEEPHLGRQMSPYNLVTHSFILYLFSLSITHVYKPDGLPPRPDAHALITMGIPLLQSTLFHLLCISKKHSNHRLIPTALTSLLGLLHFHITLFIRGYPAIFFPLLSDRKVETVFSGTGFRSSYPLMNYLSCLVETTLIGIIVLTLFLNATVQILINGRIDRVLTPLAMAASGRFIPGDDPDNGPFQWSNFPFEEEWGVVLMRIGTASLEATGLKGWGNEVAPLSAPIHSVRRPRRRRAEPDQLQVVHGSIRMGRSGVGRIIPGYATPDEDHARSSRTMQSRPVTLRGWNNEVRTVVSGSQRTGGNNMERVKWTWLWEVIRFIKAIGDVLCGLVRLAWSWAVRKGTQNKGYVRGERLSVSHHLAVEVPPPDSVAEGNTRDVYQRFLRGEDISDDEEDSDVITVDSADDPEQSENDFLSDSDEGDRTIGQHEREEEAIALLTDLVRIQGADESSKLVLSHLVYGTSATGRESSPNRPLTRRRWGDMVQRNQKWGMGIADDDINDIYDWEIDTNTRGSQTGEDWKERVSCVICTDRPRDVVSWPCRCLAMCGHCRELLAAKESPGRHRCPCCRKPVEGFSRIYLP